MPKNNKGFSGAVKEQKDRMRVVYLTNHVANNRKAFDIDKRHCLVLTKHGRVIVFQGTSRRLEARKSGGFIMDFKMASKSDTDYGNQSQILNIFKKSDALGLMFFMATSLLRS